MSLFAVKRRYKDIIKPWERHYISFPLLIYLVLITYYLGSRTYYIVPTIELSRHTAKTTYAKVMSPFKTDVTYCKVNRIEQNV